MERKFCSVIVINIHTCIYDYLLAKLPKVLIQNSNALTYNLLPESFVRLTKIISNVLDFSSQLDNLIIVLKYAINQCEIYT